MSDITTQLTSMTMPQGAVYYLSLLNQDPNDTSALNNLQSCVDLAMQDGQNLTQIQKF